MSARNILYDQNCQGNANCDRRWYLSWWKLKFDYWVVRSIFNLRYKLYHTIGFFWIKFRAIGYLSNIAASFDICHTVHSLWIISDRSWPVFEQQEKGVSCLPRMSRLMSFLFMDLNCIQLNHIRLDMYANG